MTRRWRKCSTPLPTNRSSIWPIISRASAERLGVGFVFCWFFLGGIAHFVYTDLEASIVPPWLPEPRWLVLISGVFELAGAFGVLVKRTRNLAGWGLIALTVAVTPANVYMWQHPELFPNVPYWALTLRLPLQLALIACIWWSTRIRRTR